MCIIDKGGITSGRINRKEGGDEIHDELCILDTSIWKWTILKEAKLPVGVFGCSVIVDERRKRVHVIGGCVDGTDDTGQHVAFCLENILPPKYAKYL